MLTMTAIGDAYGAGFEFVKPENCPANDLSQYYTHPKYALMAGAYTDDTQMSIAITEAILSTNNLKSLNDYDFAKSFVEAFHRDQREAYAKGFYQFLLQTKSAVEFMQNIIPKSKRNGAAMRACPIGCVKDVNRMLSLSAIQASTTHNTLEGIISAQAVAFMVNAMLYQNASKKDLPRLLEKQFPTFNWKPEHTGHVDCDGIMTVQAVITALYHNDTTADILKACVDFAGDTDSTASIALGIASVCDEIENNLPQHLFDNLEKDKNGNNTPFGRPYLKQLDDKLTQFVRVQL
jgi:ADP-ribosylglycohydrolase